MTKIHNDYRLDDNSDKKQYDDCVTTYTEILRSGTKRIAMIRVNQAFHYPEQRESLIPPSQMTWFGVTVDHHPLRFGGAQAFFTKGIPFKLVYNRSQVWFTTKAPTVSDKKLPKTDLTS